MNFKIFQQAYQDQNLNLPFNTSQVTIVCRIKKPKLQNQPSKRSASSNSFSRKSVINVITQVKRKARKNSQYKSNTSAKE